MRKPTKIIQLKTNITMPSKYENYIEGLAINEKNHLFFNSGKDHAIIVLSQIFSQAKNYVKLYSGNLNGGISSSDKYIKAVSGFLNRGGKLEILLEQFDSAKEPVIFELLKGSNNVSVKSHSCTLSSSSNQFKSIHFCIADGRMYRLENDTEKFTAQGNFNDKNVVQELESIFDKISNHETIKQLIGEKECLN